MGNAICIKPFRWLEVGADDQHLAYLCCSGWLKKSVGSMLTDDASTLWSGEAAADIRRSVLDGSFEYCDRNLCPYLSNSVNAVTSPDSPIRFVSDQVRDKYKRLTHAGVQIPPPEVVNAAYDRSCNLSCPSCRTEISKASKKQQSTYDYIFNKIMREFGHSLDLIYITGSGDPLSSRHFMRILKQNLSVQYPKLRIKLHTNAIRFGQRAWNHISSNSHIISEIEVSADGATRQVYEINRRPARWDAFLKGTHFISGLKRSGHNFFFKLNFVVQSNNWRDLPLLIRLAESWHVDAIKISSLGNWGTFGYHEYKQRAVHFSDHPEHQRFLACVRSLQSDSVKILIDIDAYQPSTCNSEILKWITD